MDMPKFRIGDDAKVVRMDRFSNKGMTQYLGRVGVVVSMRFIGKSAVPKLHFPNGKEFSWYEASLERVDEEPTDEKLA